MSSMAFLKSGEDLIIWADDTHCYRYELHEMGHMSDDYRVVYFNDAINYPAECKRLGLDF